MNFLATNLQSVSGSSLCVDLPGYNSPSLITDDHFRPDLLLSFSNECLYIVELTVGYESNLQKNVQGKKAKYSQLISEQSEHFEKVKFINISISSIGVFAKECLTFINMLNDIGIDKNNQKYLIKRMMTIAIRTTLCILLQTRNGQIQNF